MGRGGGHLRVSWQPWSFGKLWRNLAGRLLSVPFWRLPSGSDLDALGEPLPWALHSTNCLASIRPEKEGQSLKVTQPTTQWGMLVLGAPNSGSGGGGSHRVHPDQADCTHSLPPHPTSRSLPASLATNQADN